MTFRTTVRDGLIVINTHGEIPDGTEVEVLPIARARANKRRSKADRAGSKKPKRVGQGKIRPLPGFGAWKDRWPESMSSAEIARQLREQVSRRTR